MRAALSAPDAAAAVLGDVRAVVAAYEAVVAPLPRERLQRQRAVAGRTAVARRVRALRPGVGQGRRRPILRKLAAAYPTSKLAKQVPEQLTRMTPAKSACAEDTSSQRPHPPPARLRRVPATAGAEPARPAGPTRSRRSRTSAAPCCLTPCASRSSSTPRCRSTRSASRIRRACSSICPGTRAAPALVDQTLRFEGDADIVRQVRVGRHPNNTTRVVLDAAGVTSYSVYPLYSPYRLVIDCVRAPPAGRGGDDRQGARPRGAGRVRGAAERPRRAARVLPPLPARTMTNPWLRKLPRAQRAIDGAARAAAPTRRRRRGRRRVPPIGVEPTPPRRPRARLPARRVEAAPAPRPPQRRRRDGGARAQRDRRACRWRASSGSASRGS